jgi:hypothetical protein
MQMMKNQLIQMVENINVLPNINSQLPKYLWKCQPLIMNKTTRLKCNNPKRWRCWHLNGMLANAKGGDKRNAYEGN